MSDWADFVVNRLNNIKRSGPDTVASLRAENDRLNAALRAARNEALEEAAKIAEEEMVDYWIDDRDLTKNNACELVASNIRALKNKQP